MAVYRKHRYPRCTSPRRGAGQAMTEYIIVFPVMLVLIFGTLQFALLYQTKIQLNYAAFESARSGSLNNARQWALQAGFVRGIAPLYTHGAEPSGRQWLRWARSKMWDDIDTPGLVEIQIINPTPAAFTLHGTEVDDENIIPNDNLMYRDTTIGADTTALSIQEANLLKIRVFYCTEMVVPFVNRMINALLRVGTAVGGSGGPSGTVATGQLSAWSDDSGTYTGPGGAFERACLLRREGTALPKHFPLSAEAIIRMQTPPIAAVVVP
jgi:hypothetical protein